MHSKLRDRLHLHQLHWNKADSARFLSTALGLLFTAVLALCAVYMMLNIHDYPGT